MKTSIVSKEEYNQSVMYSFFIAVCIQFMIIVFAPLEIYLSNKDYFFFGGKDLLIFQLPIFAILIVFDSIFFYFIRKTQSSIIFYFFSILWGIGMAMYIQGNFMKVDYGAMNGQEIQWENYSKECILSIFLLVVMILIALGLYICQGQKWIRIAGGISICVALCQMVTILVLAVSQGGINKEPRWISTDIDEYSFSENENIIVFLLDTFDSGVFQKIMSDEPVKYASIFSDFTYYPDTCSNYPFTDLSVPSMFTGKYYLNNCSYESYLEEAYQESNVFNILKEQGYRCDYYTTSLLPQSNVSEMFNNSRKTVSTVSSHKRLMGYMYRLVGYRYLIQPLQRLCWFYPDDIENNLCTIAIDGAEAYTLDNRRFYDNLDKVEADTKEKVFKFIHIEGPHPPFSLNADFSDRGYRTYNADGIYDESRASVVIIEGFLNKLREKNIYDNSVIFILSDHGYINMRQMSLFMIKSRGEHKEFSIDKSYITYSDLPEMLCRAMDSKDTQDIVIKDRGERMYWYYDSVEMDNGALAGDIVEYKVVGSGFSEYNIYPTGKVYTGLIGK